MTWLIAKLLDPRVLIGLAIAIAVAFAAAGLRHAGFKAGAASVQIVLERERGDWANERAKAADAAASASEAYRAQEQAWAASAAKIQTEGEQRHAEVLADADRARRAAGSLRDALDIATRALRRGTAEAPATPADCASAADAARVFAELFGRADDRAGILASVADQARVSGNACVAADEVTR